MALKDVTLELKKGEILALIGEKWCWKIYIDQRKCCSGQLSDFRADYREWERILRA